MAPEDPNLESSFSAKRAAAPISSPITQPIRPSDPLGSRNSILACPDSPLVRPYFNLSGPGLQLESARCTSKPFTGGFPNLDDPLLWPARGQEPALLHHGP
ncbi:hypothetical protein VTL71DRAFT_10586 [Oculimacula yallundae]|uniref:Uncharacterized protein n=1 Tax=Oculimacula yallundae TaxID=86028 RepID=A0ABR4CUK3_9HELO